MLYDPVTLTGTEEIVVDSPDGIGLKFAAAIADDSVSCQCR